MTRAASNKVRKEKESEDEYNDALSRDRKRNHGQHVWGHGSLGVAC